MSLIQWREEFCTGISGVDYEHEELIKLINDVYALIDNKADQQTIIDALGDIYGSISAHFSLEEQMMKRHNYDQYDEHKADHDKLLDDIIDISDEFEINLNLNQELFKQRLNDWFQNHFKTHDARLHKLGKLMAHDPISESRLKVMIHNARKAFYGQTGFRR